jgi:hypothetical protein
VRDRDAGERRRVARDEPRVGGPGLGQRLLAIAGEERVEPRVERFDPIEKRACQLDAR